MDLDKDPRLVYAETLSRQKRIDYLKREGLYRKTKKGDVFSFTVVIIIIIGGIVGVMLWGIHSDNQKNKATWANVCAANDRTQLQEVKDGVLSPDHITKLAGCP